MHKGVHPISMNFISCKWINEYQVGVTMESHTNEITNKAWSIIEELCQIRLSEKMSDKSTIKTKAPKAVNKGGKPANWEIELSHNIADHLAGLIEQFGAQAVYDAAFSSLVIKFQAEVRRLAEAGIADEEIQKTMRLWGLGQKPLTRFFTQFNSLSKEQQTELLEKMANIQTHK